MTGTRGISRRQFGRRAAGLGAGLGLAAVSLDGLAQQATGGAQSGGRPAALKSEFLMDLILETQPAVQIGSRTVVGVTAGTFEGPKLRGKVMSPGADWPLVINQSLRVLDVRTLLVTDDDARIYVTYRGLIYTPPAGQGERYWRTVPIFETDSKKYEWLTQAVFVGVSFQVPQRVAYRIFQIL
jgi:Protein of unknown function (DUF3237)